MEQTSSAPTILIAVDIQKGFVTPASAHVVAPLAALQDRFDHVIFTRFHNPDPSPFREILNYHKLAPDSEETRLALKPRADAILIDRPLYTCVTAELRQILRRLDAREVYVAGIATEACVLKTVVDLFEVSIVPWVLEDLCASDKERHFHDYAIEIMGKLIDPGHIIESAAVRFAQGV